MLRALRRRDSMEYGVPVVACLEARPHPVVDLAGFACRFIVLLNMYPDDPKRLGQWREGRPSFDLANLVPSHDVKTAHEYHQANL